MERVGSFVCMVGPARSLIPTTCVADTKLIVPDTAVKHTAQLSLPGHPCPLPLADRLDQSPACPDGRSPATGAPGLAFVAAVPAGRAFAGSSGGVYRLS